MVSSGPSQRLEQLSFGLHESGGTTLFLAAVPGLPHSRGHEAFTGPDCVMFHHTNTDPSFLTS